MDFIDAMQQTMSHLKISQRSLAISCGVSNQWINFIVTRRHKPNNKMKIAIAIALEDRINEKVAVYKDKIEQLYSLTDDLEDTLHDEIFPE